MLIEIESHESKLVLFVDWSYAHGLCMLSLQNATPRLVVCAVADRSAAASTNPRRPNQSAGH